MTQVQWMPDQKTLLVKLVPEWNGGSASRTHFAHRPQHPGDDGRERAEQHV